MVAKAAVQSRSLRAFGIVIFLVAAPLLAATNLQAQTSASIWNNYAGSSSVELNFSTSASTGTSPYLSAAVGGSTNSMSYVFDTGSTGIVISQSIACNQGMIQCTGGAYNGPTTSGQGGFIGYAQIGYSSSSNGYSGFYINLPVTLCSNGASTSGACSNGAPMATSTVPVFIATSTAAGTVQQMGVGFGRPETASGVNYYSQPVPLTSPITQTPIGTLYGKALNPLLNLTQLNLGSGLTSNISSIAPGYIVTSQGVSLGLSSIPASATGGLVALTPYTPTPTTPSSLSQYAANATAKDWATPPMLMRVSNNSAGLNGSYYGTVVVDTGIAGGIITNGGTTLNGSPCTTGCVNQALVQSAIQSATPTSITISLPGVTPSGSNQLGQFTYVFQGACNTSDTFKCGPSPGTKYDGTQATINGNPTRLLIGDQSNQMIPMYPTSSKDSLTNGYGGTNTGFSDATANAAFLNTGVNFLSYFDIVYDPVSGFIGYIPNGTTAGQAANLVSASAMTTLALQGSFNIPAGTAVSWPVFLFTAVGNQAQQSFSPVDVVLSTPGTVTFSQPISSDVVANCTLANCSTGLVLNQGTFLLSAINTYLGDTTVNSGATLIVNGSIASSFDVTVNSGGTLAGIGTVSSTTINAGGMLAPGNGSTGTLSVSGNLAFQSGAIYLVTFSGVNVANTNVTGTAALAGNVQGTVSSGDIMIRSYDILHAAGGLSGAFSSVNVTNFNATLSYTGTDVFLNVTGAALGAGSVLNQNQQSVADGISKSFNSAGSLPPGFASLFNLTGPALAVPLTQLDGEAATGAERAVFQLTNEFLELMLDPFVNGRGDSSGSAGAPALGFAPDQQASQTPDVALAFASVLTKAPPQDPEQRWTAWGAAYAGGYSASGNASAGSNNVAANTYGFTGGMDYRVTPHAIAGFALAGAGTNWGLANALGTGRSDALQAGAYGITWLGPAYMAGALSFSNHWFTTNRSALGDAMTANFVGQGYGARLEGGYRYAVIPRVGVSPYGAVQFQDFHTPAYSETDATGGGFGLSYNAMNATDVRTELGSRFDSSTLLYGKPLVLYGRVAWAHDFVGNPSLSAGFQTLSGGTFTVNGAPIPRDSALTTAGARLFLTPRWTLVAKFDGEFANGSQTYAGSGTLRYAW